VSALASEKLKMTKNQHKKSEELADKYKEQKIDFLDELQPDDFRNGGSFNQAEIILEQLNKGAYRAVLAKEDPQEFVAKAVTHLFRENSHAVKKAINLSNAYIEMKLSEKKII